MRVSVAMCTYNGERYLQEQLNSLASQTYLPFELIVCDDCSSDTTTQIICRFARTSSFPVRFVQNHKTLGSTANFNQAISLCSGELIALCDQDDIWNQKKIEKQVCVFQRNVDIGGTFSNGRLIDANSKQINRSLWDSMEFTSSMQSQVIEGNPILALVRQNFVTGATLMFRAELRLYFSLIPKDWVHDAWIAWMISIYSQLYPLSDHLIDYRIHSNQQIGANLQPLQNRLKRDSHELIQLHQLELERMISLEDSIRNETSERVVHYRKLVRAKIFFIRTRIALLQKTPAMRIASVFLEAKDYMLFAKGLRSIMGDLLA